MVEAQNNGFTVGLLSTLIIISFPLVSHFDHTHLCELNAHDPIGDRVIWRKGNQLHLRQANYQILRLIPIQDYIFRIHFSEEVLWVFGI